MIDGPNYKDIARQAADRFMMAFDPNAPWPKDYDETYCPNCKCASCTGGSGADMKDVIDV